MSSERESYSGDECEVDDEPIGGRDCAWDTNYDDNEEQHDEAGAEATNRTTHQGRKGQPLKRDRRYTDRERSKAALVALERSLTE